MKNYSFILGLLFFTGSAFGADSLLVKRVEPPVRLYDKIGNRLPPQTIPIIHEMDCDEYGWRWNSHEWEKMKNGRISAPKYYFDPDHGSNHGLDVA